MLTPFAHNLTRRNAVAVCALGMAIAVLVALLSAFRAAPLQRLDNALLDALLAASVSHRPANDTAVVDIDDVSLAAVGQWPWPRYRVASLVNRIAEAGASTIALDILLPEGDRTSLDHLQQTFKHDFNLDIDFVGVPAGLRDNDGFLGHEIGRLDVVGSSYLYFDHVNRAAPPRGPGLRFDGIEALGNLEDAPGLLSNALPIARQTRTYGFVNMGEEDGVLRRLPLLIRHGETVYPSLALAATMHTLGVDRARVEAGRDGPTLRVGPHRVPIDAAGNAILQLNGGSLRYAAVSALDVLNGDLPAQALRGKTVIVGSSAVGLNDLHNTAVDARFPGLKIHAAMIENILQDDVLRTPAWDRVAIVSACLLVGALMAGMFANGSGVVAFTVGALLIAGSLLTACVALQMRAGLFVSAAAPMLVTAAQFVVLFIARFAIEKRRARAWLRQLENARQITIESMASVAETRDPETGAHIKRTQNYVRAVALELVRSGRYLKTLTPDFIELLYISAPLHDIGKVGVPDAILLKPGRLTASEMEIMKQHAEYGRRIIVSTAQRIDGENFLRIAGDIAASHHERWDGAGYPNGLAGQEIPLSGRIMAVADIYDALISRRCYKEPYTHEHATRIMRDLRGKTFDPEVIDAFFRIEREILDIARRFQDDEDHEKSFGREVRVAVLPAPPTAPAPTPAAAENRGELTSV